MKTSDKKPEDIEKRAEPAVKIEPLVINDSYSNLADYTGSSDLAKKPESKPAKAAKKGMCCCTADIFIFRLLLLQLK